MARPQTFQREEVLAQAMMLFWRKGFAMTSVRDLTEATTLQPGSLYGAFKDKRTLFQLSLETYFAKIYRQIDSLLCADSAGGVDSTPLARIENFFDYLLIQMKEDPDNKSCLLVNTLLETPPEDKAIQNQVKQMFQKIEKSFEVVLAEAQAQGQIAKNKDTGILAKSLLSGIFGLQVYNKMKPSQATIKLMTIHLLQMLRA